MTHAWLCRYESRYLMQSPNLRFALSYARRQIMPSIVWSTYDPLLVLRELGMDPKLLREFDLTKIVDVRASGSLARCRHARSVLAG